MSSRISLPFMRIAAVACLFVGMLGATPTFAKNSSKSKAELENEGIENAASGKHSCSVRDKGGKLDIRLRDLTPSTDYQLLVGGVAEAEFTTDSRGGAKLRFRTPVKSPKFLELDFDPRGKQLAVSNGIDDVLKTVVATTGESLGSSNDERVALTAVASSGSARARFRTRKDGRKDFSVELTAVADGSYALFVAGIERGTINASAGRGKIEFKSDPSAGELLLDFDPRGLTVDVIGAAGLAFSSTMIAAGQGVTVCAFSETNVSVASTGLDPDGNAKARLRTKKDCDRNFQVEIEDVPVGAYELRIDGVAKGTINVVDDGIEIEGELEFESDPDDPGELFLDFDPKDRLIEVVQGGSTFFSGSFTGGTTSATSGTACEPTEEELPLLNAGVVPAGSGDAKFRVKDDCEHDFDVEIEDVAVGNYDVFVDGTFKGTLTVVDTGFKLEGELEFSSSSDDPGELPLDFDPHGKLIEVKQGATLFFSRVFAGANSGPSSCDEVEILADLDNSGAAPAASGDTRYRVDVDCDADFSVEVEDLALGNYDLFVGGVARGTITVATVVDKVEGDIEFDSDPSEPGKVLLVFDPRGQQIEVKQGGTTYFTLNFPAN